MSHFKWTSNCKDMHMHACISWRVLLFVDGNYRVAIYIHLLDLTRNRSEKCNFRSLAGIELAAVRFRCSAQTNLLVNKLATNLLQTPLVHKLLKQHCHNLLTILLQSYSIANISCWEAVGTTLSQLVNKLATNLLPKDLLTSCGNSIVTTC